MIAIQDSWVANRSPWFIMWMSQCALNEWDSRLSSKDSDAIKRLKDRDAVFLEVLFTENNPYLMRICFANSIAENDVCELIHQTWETFLSKLDKYEGRSTIRTFICGILINKIREHRRAQKRFVPEEDAQKLLEDTFTPEGWWKVEPSDPQQILENNQLSTWIAECLQGLSEQQATVFTLREIEDENFESIGQILGVTPSHLRVLLFRAKDKLKKCLEGKLGSERALP